MLVHKYSKFEFKWIKNVQNIVFLEQGIEPMDIALD